MLWFEMAKSVCVCVFFKSGKFGFMCISHLECTHWLESCDNQEWLVANAYCKNRPYRSMHDRQHRRLDALLALYDYYCTKSNGPAERIATYQDIYIHCMKYQDIYLNQIDVRVCFIFQLQVSAGVCAKQIFGRCKWWWWFHPKVKWKYKKKRLHFFDFIEHISATGFIIIIYISIT